MTRPQFIRFGREICGDVVQAERREWWLSNGLGAYAGGTVAGTLTRRYHGLLIAPLEPPLGRSLLLAKADAWLEFDRQQWPLCSNRWVDGVVDPCGFVHIEAFWLDGRMPVWRFAFGDVRIEMRIWLETGANTVYVAYKPEFPESRRKSAKLRLKLLANARDHHGNTEPRRFCPLIEPSVGDVLTLRNPQGLGSHPFLLQVRAYGGTIRPQCDWYENFDLPVEAERGLDPRDHHLCVGECTLSLNNGEWSGLSATIENDAPSCLEESMPKHFMRDDRVVAHAQAAVAEMSTAPDWIRQLLLAADSFLFARPLPEDAQGESVIAGYPWFGDWGRDTMIALPGLTLATGRYGCARRILKTFAHFVDGGMLPNMFPGSGETPQYNSVDAALWYVEAWRAYAGASGDWAAVREIFPVLEDIVRCYREGTRYGIAVDPNDGLLAAGEGGVQLTWMDAKVGDWVVTPRRGKAVEINALWFNALQVMVQFAARLQLPAAVYETAAYAARQGFQRFLGAPHGGLYDVLDGPEGNDAALRPNQILAVSLPFSPLKAADVRRVVDVCGKELLTSYGLRSLAAADPCYVARYCGGVLERDGAYHQGTVWVWLLSHYALAEFRVCNDAAKALSRLEPIREHLYDAGLGTISEIFDAAPPHAPRGAPSQAWSVACVLEAWWRLERERLKGDAFAI